MQQKLSEKIENLILDVEKTIAGSDKKELERFEIALKEFNELVEKGVTQKRGYTLMRIEDLHRQPIFSNINIRQIQKL